MFENANGLMLFFKAVQKINLLNNSWLLHEIVPRHMAENFMKGVIICGLCFTRKLSLLFSYVGIGFQYNLTYICKYGSYNKAYKAYGAHTYIHA